MVFVKGVKVKVSGVFRLVYENELPVSRAVAVAEAHSCVAVTEKS